MGENFKLTLSLGKQYQAKLLPNDPEYAVASQSFCSTTLCQEDLCNHIAQGYSFVPAIFTNNNRLGSFFKQADFVALDYDGCNVSFEEFQSKIQGFCYYRSYSDCEEDHRFRVLIKLDDSIFSMDEYRHYTTILRKYFEVTQGVMGFDYHSTSGAQFFFGTNKEVVYNQSECNYTKQQLDDWNEVGFYDTTTIYNDSSINFIVTTTKNPTRSKTYVSSTLKQVLYEAEKKHTTEKLVKQWRFNYKKHSDVEYNEFGLANLSQRKDYYEIIQFYTWDSLSHKREIQKITEGARNNQLDTDALVLMKINNFTHPDELLKALTCEKFYRYDDPYKEFTTRKLISIANWAFNVCDNHVSPTKKRYKVDTKYYKERYNLTGSAAYYQALRCTTEDKILSSYDFADSLENNAKALNLSPATIKSYLKNNGYIWKTKKDLEIQNLMDLYDRSLGIKKNAKLLGISIDRARTIHKKIRYQKKE